MASKTSGSGNERYAFELLSGLKLRQNEVEVLHSGTSLSFRGKRVSPISAAYKEAVITTRLISAKADIYHAICPNGGKNAIFVRKSPLVVTILDMIPFHSDQFYPTVVNMYRRFSTLLSANKSQRIIALFPSTKHELVSRFGMDPSRIEVIPCGVDRRHFYPREVERGNVKRILYVGGISRAKGIVTLLEAFNLLTRRISDVELVVVGRMTADIPQKDYMGRLVSRHAGQPGRVKFVGFVSEERLPLYYSSADLSVFPSYLGFGLPTLEAMACGTPTIAGNSLDARILATSSLLVEPGNVKQLSEAMFRVLTKEDLRKGLIKRGIETAKSLSWETMVENTLKTYEQVMSA
jgi:glycosyltransferase involved in cell wall biosynthesis